MAPPATTAEQALHGRLGDQLGEAGEAATNVLGVSLQRRLQPGIPHAAEKPAQRIQPRPLEPFRDVGFPRPRTVGSHLDERGSCPVECGVRIRVRRAQPVLLRVIIPVGLDERGQGGVERNEAGADGLQGDAIRAEYRKRRRAPETVRRAVDVEMAGAGGDRALVEDDPVALDAANMPEADDVLDAAQQIELPVGDRGRLVHRGPYALVDAPELPGGIEAIEEVVDGCRLGSHLHLQGDSHEQGADGPRPAGNRRD